MFWKLLGAVPARRTVRQAKGRHTTGRGLLEEHKVAAAPGHDPKMVARLVANRQGLGALHSGSVYEAGRQTELGAESLSEGRRWEIKRRRTRMKGTTTVSVRTDARVAMLFLIILSLNGFLMPEVLCTRFQNIRPKHVEYIRANEMPSDRRLGDLRWWE